MSAQFQKENWLKILDAAREMEGAADGPHPVDDDALLNRWSMGLLSANEHQHLIDHLANCPQCRQIVASMIRTESLQLPEVPEPAQKAGTEPVLPRKQPQATGRYIPRILLSVAGILLVGVMLYQWSGFGPLVEVADLKMQPAERSPQPILLAQLDRLDHDFGYDFSGYSATKSLDPFGQEDQTTKRIRNEYETEIKQHPDAMDLKLNYGQFLLKSLEIEKAIQQFDAVLAMQPKNVFAIMGRGLSYYRIKQYEQAASSFRAVLKQNPDSLSAKINLAITCQKQNKTEQATRLWKEIEQDTTDDNLKQQINNFLNR